MPGEHTAVLMRGNTGMIKKYIAVILAASALLLASCGSGGGIQEGEPGNGKWVNPDIDGSITAESDVRLQDNFAAAVNKDILQTFPVPEDRREGTLYEGDRALERKLGALLRDESMTGREAEELSTFVSLAENWDKRNAEGVEPLRKYIRSIEEISSLPDMTAYLKSTEKNPFALGPMMPATVMTHLGDPTKTVLALSPCGFVFGDDESGADKYDSLDITMLECQAVFEERMQYILGRLGYDEARIKELIGLTYSYEKRLGESYEHMSEKDMATSAANKPRAEMQETAGDYPLLEICDARGWGGAEILTANTGLLRGAGKAYNENHLNEMKAYLIARLVAKTEKYLDRETYDKKTDREVSRTDPDAKPQKKTDDARLIELVTESGMRPAMDQLFIDKYYPDQSDEDELIKIITDIKGSYREMLLSEEWLSEDSRKKALEKLDMMAVHAIRPDDEADYSSMHITPAGEGGTFLDAFAEGKKFIAAKDAELLAEGIDRTKWSIYGSELSTTQMNAMYEPNLNAFFILAGYLTEPVYSPSMSCEEKLGAVGVTIGHEISHGFDENGSRRNGYGQAYDGDEEADWMTSADRNAYEAKVQKLRSYFSLVRPLGFGSVVDGYNISGEATADIAGMKAVLMLAAKTPGFDYDKFFRAYAGNWAVRSTENIERDMMMGDSHPLNYLRVNIVVQQYDEFLDTYGVKPGDGMYLEPDRRITVW